MKLIAQQAGLGPITTIQVGASSAPMPIANVQVVTTVEATDLALIVRNGTVMEIPWSILGEDVAPISVDALPTALPSTSGTLWNNGGFLAIS